MAYRFAASGRAALRAALRAICVFQRTGSIIDPEKVDEKKSRKLRTA